MEEPGRRQRPLREPIHSPWVWVVMAVVILGGVPFYLPTGSVTPLVAGVPFWMVVSVAFTLAFAAFTSWLCARWWNLVEDEEENGRGAEAAAARGPGGGASWES
jgi:hypothetical protein